MLTQHLALLAGGAAFASALVAGVFLAFSDFVMQGLSRAPREAGLAAMQGINRAVYRSLFLVLLMGSAPAFLALAIAAAGHGAAFAWLAFAAAVYGLGVVAVTVAGNVPMNERLDRLDLGGPAAMAAWLVYARRWTILNHLRTAASAAAALGAGRAALLLAAPA